MSLSWEPTDEYPTFPIIAELVPVPLIPLDLSVFDEMEIVFTNENKLDIVVVGVHVNVKECANIQTATVLSYNEFDVLCDEID